MNINDIPTPVRRHDRYPNVVVNNSGYSIATCSPDKDGEEYADFLIVTINNHEALLNSAEIEVQATEILQRALFGSHEEGDDLSLCELAEEAARRIRPSAAGGTPRSQHSPQPDYLQENP